MQKAEVYFSLGSNLGDRLFYLKEAVRRMEAYFGIHYTSFSSIIETDPWGFESDDKFLNAAVRFDFPMVGQDPHLHSLSILSVCKKIERELGRNTTVLYEGEKRIYTSRPIDIDILLYEDMKLSTPLLSIPHLLMKEREFVMVPLREIVSVRMKEAHPDIFR